MDARGLARARRWTGTARPDNRRHQRTRRCGAPRSRSAMAGHRHRPFADVARQCRAARARESTWSRHIDHPSRRRHGLPDSGPVRADRPSCLGTLASRRHGHAMAGGTIQNRGILDRAEFTAMPALHLGGLRAAYRQRNLPGRNSTPSRCWRRPVRRWPKAANLVHRDCTPIVWDASLPVATGAAPMHDIVIRGGTIIDVAPASILHGRHCDRRRPHRRRGRPAGPCPPRHRRGRPAGHARLGRCAHAL